MAMTEISRPPGAGTTPFDEVSGSNSSIMPATPGQGVGGGERAAVAYLETAVEMLDAAGEEAPQLMGAIQAIKEFMAQSLAQAMGMGQSQPPQEAPVQPPQMFGGY